MRSSQFQPGHNRLATATSRKEWRTTCYRYMTSAFLTQWKSLWRNASTPSAAQQNRWNACYTAKEKFSYSTGQVSLFDDDCLKYEPFQTAFGPMFREIPRLTSSLTSNLVFSHSWKQQFICKSHLKCRIQCTSSNPVTNWRVIRQFHSFFFVVVVAGIKKKGVIFLD